MSASATRPSSSSSAMPVQLSGYKDGAVTVTVPRPQVSEEAVSAVVSSRAKTKFRLVPVRVVDEGGTRMGHTVVCDWKATYLQGGSPEMVAQHKLRPGVVLPGADVKSFTLDLKEDQPEPLRSFAKHVAVGMGQMETKMFEVDMPANMKKEAWRGVRAKVMLLVRSINVKEEVEADGRPEEERREEARQQLMKKAEAESESLANAAIREALLETCHADTKKMEESVSWAKFGERSLKDFKWQLIQEAIASAEGLTFEQVPAFLRASNNIVYA